MSKGYACLNLRRNYGGVPTLCCSRPAVINLHKMSFYLAEWNLRSRARKLFRVFEAARGDKERAKILSATPATRSRHAFLILIIKYHRSPRGSSWVLALTLFLKQGWMILWARQLYTVISRDDNTYSWDNYFNGVRNYEAWLWRDLCAEFSI